jgi:AcrR family transcriptional regulator/DNA-binding MarR family transcriptional regulator
MVAAMVEVARERGLGGATVAHIVARSGVSRRTFYELFEDREACFLAAFELAVGRAAAGVVPAYRAGGGWVGRIRAGLGALLEFLDDEPGLGGLCVVDALGAGPVALEYRARVVGVLIDVVDEGRGQARVPAGVDRLTAEGVVGAVLAVLHARLIDAANARGASRAGSGSAAGAGCGSMVGLLGPFMAMIVLPYLGRAAADREIARPVPQRRRVASRLGDPLRDLDMRLTYRTVRVLLAIASDPGASNRRVADAAGVADQGQISKLLARLEHLGLIDNSGAGPARGEPNVWRLTPRGEEVARAIRTQTGGAGRESQRERLEDSAG